MVEDFLGLAFADNQPFLAQFSDYQDYAVQGTIRNNPRLERSIALFNSLSQWLQCMILSRTNPEQRAQVMVKFINVAKVSTTDIC